MSLSKTAIEEIRRGAEKFYTIEKGRTLDVKPCRFCLYPIFSCEHDTGPGENSVTVLDGEMHALCANCERMARNHPEVVAWINTVFRAHMMAAHAKE
jgi:hypothetical protein